MNHTFFKRHATDPRRGRQRGGREYDENGIPVEGLPAGERPVYSNDERPISLRAGGNGGADEAEADDALTGSGSASSSGAQPPESGGGQSSGESAQEGGSHAPYDLDEGLTNLYTNLYNKLAAYGVTSIPTFDALYGLFESFLRPSIDEAIRARQRRGESNRAELDADAYSRGLGGSSYLSSMKAREQDDVEDDIMGLEAKYSATLAEYLYNALSAMQQLEASLAKTAMQYGYGGSSSSHSSSGSHSSSSSSSGSSSGSESGGVPYGHNKNGAYFDGVWYEGDFSYLQTGAGYNDYAAYIEGLSAGQRYLLFTSDKREWRMRRWQMQYDLTQFDYNELYETYFVLPSGGGGGGEAYWREMLY